jgi:hypothetical protein
MPKNTAGYTWDKSKNRWRIRFSYGENGERFTKSLGPEWKEKQVIEYVATKRHAAIQGMLGREDHLITKVLDMYLERKEGSKGYYHLCSHVRALMPWIAQKVDDQWVGNKKLSQIGDIARDYRSF